MKSVVLLTRRFPYLEGESFVAGELPQIPQDISLVIAETRQIPADAQQQFPCPAGVQTLPLFRTGFSLLEKIQCAVAALFQPCFWAEVGELYKCHAVTALRLRELIGFAARGERIYSALKVQFGGKLREDAANCIIYSYWLDESAYAAVRLHHQYGCRGISRAHRDDLYAEERTSQYLPLRRYLLAGLDGCFPISENGQRYLTKRYGFAEKIQCVRLGSSDCGEAPVPTEPQKVHLVSCSYMVPVKRIPLLVHALSYLGEMRLEWTHMGDGPERDAIEREIVALPPSIQVNLLGNMAHEAVLSYYHSHPVTLFVNVSSSEGIPVSIMEAMSFGIPVVATDVGGTGELVLDEETGYLVSEDVTAEQLSVQIRRLLSLSPAEYAVMRRRARSHWNENYNAAKNHRVFFPNYVLGGEEK